MEEERIQIPITVEGSVTSLSDERPIAGATVYLGAGGHFTAGTLLDSVVTNAEGRYRIEHEITHYPDSPAGCQLWLNARAEGFELVPGGWADGLYGLPCSPVLQTVEVVMR